MARVSVVYFRLGYTLKPLAQGFVFDETTSLLRGTLLFSLTGVSSEMDFYICVCMGTWLVSTAV